MTGQRWRPLGLARIGFGLSAVRARYALWLLVVLIPPLMVALGLEAEWRRYERLDTVADAERWAGHAAADHERLILGSQQWLEGVMTGLASLPPSEAAARAFLEACLLMEAEYLNVGIIDPRGTIVLSGRPPTGPADVGHHTYFRRAVESRAFAIGDFEFDGARNRTSLTVAAPVLDESGDVRHVVFGVVEVSWLKKFARDAQLAKGTTVAVIDAGGAIVLHEPDPERWVDHPAPPALRDRAGALSNTAIEAAAQDGIERVYGLKTVSGHEGAHHVAVGIPKALATVRSESLLALAFTGFGLAGLMSVLIAVAGTEVFFLRPLEKIANTALRLRCGDLTARTGMRRRGDELNQLAATIDEMAADLQAREQDVREQHEQLVYQERRFRALIENSADGIALIGPDGTFQYVSPSIRRIIGYESADLIKHHPLTWIHPDDREKQQATLAELLERPGGVAYGVFRLRHKDKSWRWIDSVHTNLLADPAVHAIVSNCRDITTRLEAEDALRTVCDELETRVADRTAELVAANTSLEGENASRTRAEAALRRLNIELENEAKRIAGALHDDAGQLLTVAHNTLADIAHDLPVDVRDRLQVVRTQLDGIESQLHHLAHELRPRVLEDLGLVGGLEFLAGSVSRRTGIPIMVDVAIDGRYDSLVETALYRVTQEALNNVARHSGATRAEVVFRQNGHGVRGTIMDDGRGFDAPAALVRRGEASLGLRGMQDRLEAVRGRLEIVTEPDGGTKVHVTIPWEDVNAASSTAR